MILYFCHKVQKRASQTMTLWARARDVAAHFKHSFFFLFFFGERKTGTRLICCFWLSTRWKKSTCRVPPQCLLTMYKAISSLSGRCAALTRGSCSMPCLAYFHRASGEFSLLQLQHLPPLYKCVMLFGLLLLQCRRSVFQLIDSTIFFLSFNNVSIWRSVTAMPL